MQSPTLAQINQLPELCAPRLDLAIEATGRAYGEAYLAEKIAWEQYNDAVNSGSSEKDDLFRVASFLESVRVVAFHEWQNAKAAMLGVQS